MTTTNIKRMLFLRDMCDMLPFTALLSGLFFFRATISEIEFLCGLLLCIIIIIPSIFVWVIPASIYATYKHSEHEWCDILKLLDSYATERLNPLARIYAKNSSFRLRLEVMIARYIFKKMA